MTALKRIDWQESLFVFFPSHNNKSSLSTMRTDLFLESDLKYVDSLPAISHAFEQRLSCRIYNYHVTPILYFWYYVIYCYLLLPFCWIPLRNLRLSKRRRIRKLGFSSCLAFSSFSWWRLVQLYSRSWGSSAKSGTSCRLALVGLCKRFWHCSPFCWQKGELISHRCDRFNSW